MRKCQQCIQMSKESIERTTCYLIQAHLMDSPVDVKNSATEIVVRRTLEQRLIIIRFI